MRLSHPTDQRLRVHSQLTLTHPAQFACPQCPRLIGGSRRPTVVANSPLSLTPFPPRSSTLRLPSSQQQAFRHAARLRASTVRIAFRTTGSLSVATAFALIFSLCAELGLHEERIRTHGVQYSRTNYHELWGPLVAYLPAAAL